MSSIYTEGGTPLVGNVKIAGAKNSALKIIHASMFSNEDITLDNVPRIDNVLTDLQIINQMGGKAEWVGGNKLILNGSGISTFEIPFELGSKNRTACLLAPALIFRFGQAVVPKPGGCKIGLRPINRLIETWNALGIISEEDEKYVHLRAERPQNTNIGFKVSTHMGTDNAILSSIFVPGETIITNAAEEPEVDDLISFVNLLGADVKRVEPRVIRVAGKNVFGGGSYKLINDRNEIVTFAVAAIVTDGNITLSGVDKSHILSFTNVLSKIGCQYEFSKDEMRIWRAGEILNPIDITTSPAPGFMTDWQPIVTLLLTKCEGQSLMHDTVYTDRFEYVKDLNRMGAKIELLRPSEVGLMPVISDDLYDFKKLGEPKTIARVTGPVKLRGARIDIPDLRAGAALILASLCADGKSELSGYENVERGYENLLSKLSELGAKII